MKQDEISVEECISNIHEIINERRRMTIEYGIATIAHLRRLQEVEAGLEKCRRDAERYDKLKSISKESLLNVFEQTRPARRYGGVNFDEAIDAGMSREEKS